MSKKIEPPEWQRRAAARGQARRPAPTQLNGGAHRCNVGATGDGIRFLGCKEAMAGWDRENDMRRWSQTAITRFAALKEMCGDHLAARACS